MLNGENIATNYDCEDDTIYLGKNIKKNYLNKTVFVFADMNLTRTGEENRLPTLTTIMRVVHLILLVENAFAEFYVLGVTLF